MVNRRTVAALAALGAIVAANFVSACVKSDDQDSFETPAPPTPTPPPPTHRCLAAWTAQNADDPATADVLVLDGPASAWLNGVATLSTDATSGFAYYFFIGADPTVHTPDVTTAPYFTLSDGTNDAFTISGMNINGTDVGAPVTITDTNQHIVYTLDTANNPAAWGMAGPASFDGTFSDLSGSLDLGTGTATVSTSSTYNLGSFGSFVGCYDVSQ